MHVIRKNDSHWNYLGRQTKHIFDCPQAPLNVGSIDLRCSYRLGKVLAQFFNNAL